MKRRTSEKNALYFIRSRTFGIRQILDCTEIYATIFPRRKHFGLAKFDAEFTRKSTFWIIYILSTEYMRNKINMQANGREWKHQKRSKRNYSTWMYRENTTILFLKMRSISSNFFNNWKPEASSLRYFSHMDNCYACENYYML